MVIYLVLYDLNSVMFVVFSSPTKVASPQPPVWDPLEESKASGNKRY